MNTQRAMLIRKQYDSLPTEAKQYVDALVLEAKQNPKSKYLEHLYKTAVKDNVMDTYVQLKYNDANDANDAKKHWISFVAFKAWLFVKTDANLFLLSVAIASNFVGGL
ncbi:hypothetical protein AVV41_gp030 [Microcystis phage MaMV-DC]|uniref:Uncharacterized protein n=1 Tax=Microcystis phage MaMV-DC TaxID=1357715 RepID=A0A075BUQ2_9CAUD|nr:hypothetical protein AVV41_gp030 [Microcystis phage MaMV-DC]AGR48595.1 hypothetical protein MaMVDC_30 [Microcystis phage MaMV-DC]